jgi:hypothetical protein
VLSSLSLVIACATATVESGGVTGVPAQAESEWTVRGHVRGQTSAYLRQWLDGDCSGSKLGAVLTYQVQFGGARFHPGPVSMLAPFALIGFVVLVGAFAVPLLGLIVSGTRGLVRSRRGRRRRLRAAASAELRARALMSELCPHGWRAQITMVAGEEDEPPKTADGRRAQVALDWTELRDETGRAAVMRRVWAPTISEALEAMVADRRTDETLEQIEQGAVADGALWPDL